MSLGRAIVGTVAAGAVIGGGVVAWRALDRSAWEPRPADDAAVRFAERANPFGSSDGVRTARLGQRLTDRHFGSWNDAAAAARSIDADGYHLLVSRTSENGNHRRIYIYDVESGIADALPTPGEDSGKDYVSGPEFERKGADESTFGFQVQHGDERFAVTNVSPNDYGGRYAFTRV